MLKFAQIGAISAVAIAAFALPAAAKCTKLGFSVNDYGKEGPIRDAKALLDKHIAKVMAESGIKNYRTGPKEVTCELFLDFGFFDEHTCKASAVVCWNEAPGQKPVQASAPGGAQPASKPAQTKPKAKEATTTKPQ